MAARESFSLKPTRQLRRRKVVNRLMEALMLTAALVAVAVLDLEAENALPERERTVDVRHLQVDVPDVYARIDRHRDSVTVRRLVAWHIYGDYFEDFGRGPSRNHGIAHGVGYTGGDGWTVEYDLAGGARFSDAFR